MKMDKETALMVHCDRFLNNTKQLNITMQLKNEEGDGHFVITVKGRGDNVWITTKEHKYTWEYSYRCSDYELLERLQAHFKDSKDVFTHYGF